MLPLPKTIGALTLSRHVSSFGGEERYEGRLGGPTGRQVIARRIPATILHDEQKRKEIEARIQDLLGVRHPFLVPVVDSIPDGEERFLIEELPPGTSLDRVIEWCQQNRRSLPHNVFLNIATQLCNGLEALHGRPGKGSGVSNILHGSLLPSCVFVTRDGKVLLGNYGLLALPSIAPSTPLTALRYLSPEQLQTETRPVPASDIFVLAALFFELLTLEPLFPDEDPQTLQQRIRRADTTVQVNRTRDLMPGLDKVLGRALSASPQHRYQRAFVLREDLRGLMAGYSFASIADDTRRFLEPLFATAARAETATARPVPQATDAPGPLDTFDDMPSTRIDPDPTSTAALASQAAADRAARERQQPAAPAPFGMPTAPARPTANPPAWASELPPPMSAPQQPARPGWGAEPPPVAVTAQFLESADVGRPTMPFEEHVEPPTVQGVHEQTQPGPTDTAAYVALAQRGKAPPLSPAPSNAPSAGFGSMVPPAGRPTPAMAPPPPRAAPPPAPTMAPAAPRAAPPPPAPTMVPPPAPTMAPPRPASMEQPSGAVDSTFAVLAAAAGSAAAMKVAAPPPPAPSPSFAPPPPAPSPSFAPPPPAPTPVLTAPPPFAPRPMAPPAAPPPAAAPPAAAFDAPMNTEESAFAKPSFSRSVPPPPRRGAGMPEPLAPPPAQHSFNAPPPPQRDFVAPPPPQAPVYVETPETTGDVPPKKSPMMPVLMGFVGLVTVMLCSGGGIYGYTVWQSKKSSMIERVLAEGTPKAEETPPVVATEPELEAVTQPVEKIAQVEVPPPVENARDRDAFPVTTTGSEPSTRTSERPTAVTSSTYNAEPRPTRTYSEPARSDYSSSSTSSSGGYSGGRSSSSSSSSRTSTPEPSYPSAYSSSSTEDGVADAVEPSASTHEESVLDLDRYASSAASGALTASDVMMLETIQTSDPTFTRSRLLLVMNSRKKRDNSAIKQYIGELGALPENNYNPVVQVEAARYYVNVGDFQRAIEKARLAELHWARIPPELIFVKKAEIYEIQAASYQGLFYKSEDNTELLEQAIHRWEVYRDHVSQKSRSDLVSRANGEIKKLEDIKARLQ